MVSYCASCGDRVSLPRQDAGILLGPGQPFLCPECRTVQLRDVKASEKDGQDQAPPLARSSSC